MVASTSLGQNYITKNGSIKFFSDTPMEKIEAYNQQVNAALDIGSGNLAFNVLMKSFKFEKAMMQNHYNSDKFLDTKGFPKAKLKGKITNLADVDFTKDGKYSVVVEGELTIKGKTNSISEKGTIDINGSSVNVQSKFNITLADYGINFVEGKPSTNIAKEVEVTVHSEYSPE